MAAAGFAFSVHEAEETRATDGYADVTSGATLVASASPSAANEVLNTGQWLVVGTAKVRSSTASDEAMIRMVFGATTEPIAAGATEHISENSTQGTAGYCVMFVYKWSPGGSTDTMRFQLNRSGTATTTVEMCSLSAINLDDLDTDDWRYNENDTPSATLDNTWTTTNNASVTIPAVAGDDWLVLTMGNFSTGGHVNASPSMRISDGTNTTPESRREPEDNTNDTYHVGLMRPYTSVGASTTFEQQVSVQTGSSGTRTRLTSTIFALRLNAFEDFASQYTDGTIDINIGGGEDPPDYATEIAALTDTATTTGDFWVLACAHNEWASSAGGPDIRLHLDGATVAGAARQMVQNANAGDDSSPQWLQTTKNYTATNSIDVDLEASSRQGSAHLQAHRSLICISMELAGAAPAGAPPQMLMAQNLGAGIIDGTLIK